VLIRSKLAYKCMLDWLEFYPPSVQHSVNLCLNDCGHFLVYFPSSLLLIVLGTSIRISDRKRAVFSKVSTHYSVFRGECRDNTFCNSLSPLHLSTHSSSHLFFFFFNAVGFTTLRLNSASIRNIRPLPPKNTQYLLFMYIL